MSSNNFDLSMLLAFFGSDQSGLTEWLNAQFLTVVRSAKFQSLPESDAGELFAEWQLLIHSIEKLEANYLKG